MEKGLNKITFGDDTKKIKESYICMHTLKKIACFNLTSCHITTNVLAIIC